MNDIMEPTKEGATPTSPNTLNLRTPEQEEAARKAAQERAARAAAQGGNVVNSIDGMTPATGTSVEAAPANMAPEVKPVMPMTVAPEVEPAQPSTSPAPAVGSPPSPEGSLYKLDSTIPEEKQGVADAPVAEQPAPEKKPGFFKRLFGGGKNKHNEQPPATPDTPEQNQ